MTFMLGEILLAAASLNLGYFMNLVLGNLPLLFMLVVLYGVFYKGKPFVPGFFTFLLMLWALLGVLLVMGWREAPFLEFSLFNIGLMVLDRNTRFNKYHVPVLLGAFLLASWLVS